MLFQGFEIPVKEEELPGTVELCWGRMGSTILKNVYETQLYMDWMNV